jgi:hypothetical protein
VANGGTVILARTLVSGNTAPTGPEIDNSGAILADNHNLFGVNGTAGVEGFTPGATDIVPPAGVLLPDIFKPRPTNNGGPTPTIALVPGSLAIDAGGPACLHTDGTPLSTDQRGQPRLMDGDGNGTVTCDIGAFEFAPHGGATILVNAHCTLIDAITAANTDTATGGCPAGSVSVADTIVLPTGSTQTLTGVNNTTYGPTGLPVIRSVITIAGRGSTIVRDSGAPDFRIFAVGSTGDLTLEETTVSGGVSPIGINGDFTYNGGGVANYGGILTVTHSAIAGNAAYYGGGGVYSSGAVTMTNSTIAGNAASSRYGGGVFNYGTLTITNSTIADNTAGYSGGGIANSPSIRPTYGGTVTIMNSTIADNAAQLGGGVANGVGSHGTLTITNSTISDNNGGFSGGGVANFHGTLTVTNSTISDNYAGYGGGVRNSSAVTITNSTIAGNAAVEGGGIRSYRGGALTVTNSTITGNAAADYGGGVANGLRYFDPFSATTLTLTQTLVSGNTAPTGSEILNHVPSTISANNHNLFGVNGSAGVFGFSPGPTDIVPPVGVQLGNILNPVLAFNGGPTQTHALVPGSLAIDAGGPACNDANGNPLLTDQRGKPRIIDGNRDGTARCDIGAFEFFPVVNNFVTLNPDLDTSFDPTPVPDAPAGTFTIGATFTNTSGTPLRFPFFTVAELSGDNLLLNAEEGARGVGATVTPDVGDQLLSPGETVQVDFVIGLQTRTPFTFFVDLFGEPLVSGSPTSRRRPNVVTKGGRR